MQASLFPGLTARLNFQKVNQAIQHSGHAHSYCGKQCVPAGVKKVVIETNATNDVSHEAKWIQPSGKMHKHRMKPVLSQPSLQQIEPHKLNTENNRMRNATTAAAA